MEKLPAYIAENVPLAPLTTLRAGGAARYLSRPASALEVTETLALAERLSLPVLVLGGGSNILVADEGVDAMVVSLADTGEFGKIEYEGNGILRVGAAVPLPALVAETVRLGMAGLAPMAGIPGSVGGAAAMNAGSADAGIGTFVREALVCAPECGLRVMGREELGFSYRHSNLGGTVALSFLMHFPDAGEPEQLAESAREFLEKKKASQPLGQPSAGCVFKNPPNISAGALLDAAGCKNMVQGGARVSEVHANFIVTDGAARSLDIAALAMRMRKKVADSVGVRLEPEIIFWNKNTGKGAQA
jgi:UDP-N-acetylmuramate dehydrogenase